MAFVQCVKRCVSKAPPWCQKRRSTTDRSVSGTTGENIPEDSWPQKQLRHAFRLTYLLYGTATGLVKEKTLLPQVFLVTFLTSEGLLSGMPPEEEQLVTVLHSSTQPKR